jgi:hypothetical protein
MRGLTDLGTPPAPPPRRVAKATGATVVLTLADMEGNEAFDPANLGSAEEVTGGARGGGGGGWHWGTRASNSWASPVWGAKGCAVPGESEGCG